jgi:hypothetical protein
MYRSSQTAGIGSRLRESTEGSHVCLHQMSFFMLDVRFASPTPVERHACASRHPVPMPHVSWIPAFAGMTRGHKDWQCIYETDI